MPPAEYRRALRQAEYDRLPLELDTDGTRLVVETDSWSAHGGRVAYAEDRERDLWLTLNGYEAVRFTLERLREAPAAAAADIGTLLRRLRGRRQGGG